MSQVEPTVEVDTPAEKFAEPPSFEDVDSLLAQSGQPAEESPAEPSEEASAAEEPGEGGEQPPEGTGTVEQPPPPEPAAPDVWEYDDGTRITKEDALAFAQFNNWLAENPQAAEVIRSAIAGEQPAPVQGPPALPEDLDLSDPTAAYLAQQFQTTQAQWQQAYNDLAQRLQSHEAQLNFQQESNLNALVRQAQANFRSEHELNDEDMARVHQIADRMINVAGLVDHDPLSGSPVKPDAIRALENAYKAAARFDDALYEADVAKRVEASRESNQKKAKLTSLAGSSGSTPRTPRPPATPQEAEELYVNDIARAMNHSVETP